jgi:hypothetical protein
MSVLGHHRRASLLSVLVLATALIALTAGLTAGKAAGPLTGKSTIRAGTGACGENFSSSAAQIGTVKFTLRGTTLNVNVVLNGAQPTWSYVIYFDGQSAGSCYQLTDTLGSMTTNSRGAARDTFSVTLNPNYSYTGYGIWVDGGEIAGTFYTGGSDLVTLS